MTLPEPTSTRPEHARYEPPSVPQPKPGGPAPCSTRSATTTTSSASSCVATFVWGLVGMLVGLVIALQLANPAFNVGPWFDVRPAAAAAHERRDLRVRRQRVLRRRVLLDAAAAQGADVLRPPEPIPFLGLAGDHRRGRDHAPLGFTQAKEYAELEWPIDIAIAVVWVVVRGQLLRHDRASGASGISTSRSGSTSRASSRSRSCTSSTTSSIARRARSRATRSTPACRTRSCSGGTATTPSRSSSRRRSSG